MNMEHVLGSATPIQILFGAPIAAALVLLGCGLVLRRCHVCVALAVAAWLFLNYAFPIWWAVAHMEHELGWFLLLFGLWQVLIWFWLRPLATIRGLWAGYL